MVRRAGLNNREPRGNLYSIGLVALVMGVLCTVMGGLLIALGAGFFAGRGRFHTSPKVVLFAGVDFALAGVLLTIQWLRGKAAQRRRDQFRLQASQPWLWDADWRPPLRDDSNRQVIRAAWGALVFAVFMMPFNVFALTTPKLGTLFWVIFGLFNLVIVVLILRATHLVLRRSRFGRTTVRIDSFPVFTGGVLSGTAQVPRSLLAQPLTLDVRCIEEQIVRADESTGIRLEERYCASQSFIAQPGPDGTASVSFRVPIPEDAPGTQLAVDAPTYWEIELKAAKARPHYAAHILVPVYRPQN